MRSIPYMWSKGYPWDIQRGSDVQWRAEIHENGSSDGRGGQKHGTGSHQHVGGHTTIKSQQWRVREGCWTARKRKTDNAQMLRTTSLLHTFTKSTVRRCIPQNFFLLCSICMLSHRSYIWSPNFKEMRLKGMEKHPNMNQVVRLPACLINPLFQTTHWWLF